MPVPSLLVRNRPEYIHIYAQESLLGRWRQLRLSWDVVSLVGSMGVDGEFLLCWHPYLLILIILTHYPVQLCCPVLRLTGQVHDGFVVRNNRRHVRRYFSLLHIVFTTYGQARKKIRVQCSIAQVAVLIPNALHGSRKRLGVSFLLENIG